MKVESWRKSRIFAIRPSRLNGPFLARMCARAHKRPMPFLPMPDPAADREHEAARRHPDQETLELATAGAAKVLGPDHGVTKALARASITMATVDLWHARLAVKTLRRDQRQAIAAAAEA